MTGPEHYAEGERLAAASAAELTKDVCNHSVIEYAQKQAALHFAAAQAAATALGAMLANSGKLMPNAYMLAEEQINIWGRMLAGDE